MNVIETFFTNTYTCFDFYRRYSLLKEFFSYIRYTDNDFKDRASSVFVVFEKFSIERKVSTENMKVFKKWGESFFYDLVGIREDSEFFLNMEKRFEKAPLLTLHTPIKFSEEDIRDLGFWARQNVDKEVFINTFVDYEIVAGCLFNWNGTLYDMSYEVLRRESHKKMEFYVKSFLENKLGKMEERNLSARLKEQSGI